MKFFSFPVTYDTSEARHKRKHQTHRQDCTFHDVMGQNRDVFIAISPRVFVVKAQRVEDLVADVTRRAGGSDKQWLHSTDEAHK